jgi:hypothetical protein
MKKLTFFLLLSVSLLLVNGQTVRLSREKQILLLHNIDSLLKNYEFYSTLSEGNVITENQKDAFIKLFVSDTVSVFDDITPNYINNNEAVINEKLKKVSEYIKDVGTNYTYLYCRLLETDAGTLYGRLRPLDGKALSVSIKIRKEAMANSKTSEGARYETSTYQDLVLRIDDTTSCKPLIAEIKKSGTSKWNYVAPFSKMSPWEKLLTLNVGMTRLNYGDAQTLDVVINPSIKSKPSLAMMGEMRYLFKNYESYKIGGSVGFGISYLSSVYSADSYQTAFDAVDKDSEHYYQIYELTSLSEKSSIVGINIPVKLGFEKSFSMTNGFFMNIGAIFSYYKGLYKFDSKNYTSLGYYPQYNAVIRDLPAYGFKTTTDYTSKGSLPMKSINAGANIDIGMYFRLKNKSQLYIGLNYYQALLNLAKEENMSLLTPNSDPTKDPVYNGFMSQSGSCNLSVIGITVGIKRLPKTAGTLKSVNYLKQ